MSTDLQPCQDLSKMIKLSPLKILTQQQQDEEAVGVIIQKEGAETELCKTPTSEKHKIPEILCCPKAPKKPKTRSSTISCKRKLQLLADDEFQFFEILNRDEVEEFFRTNLKRSCTAYSSYM